MAPAPVVVSPQSHSNASHRANSPLHVEAEALVFSMSVLGFPSEVPNVASGLSSCIPTARLASSFFDMYPALFFTGFGTTLLAATVMVGAPARLMVAGAATETM